MPKIVVTLTDPARADQVLEGLTGMSVDQWGNLNLGKQYNGDPAAIFRAGTWDHARSWE